MFCKYCGVQIDAEDAFCTGCGKALQPRQDSPGNLASPRQTAPASLVYPQPFYAPPVYPVPYPAYVVPAAPPLPPRASHLDRTIISSFWSLIWILTFCLFFAPLFRVLKFNPEYAKYYERNGNFIYYDYWTKEPPELDLGHTYESKSVVGMLIDIEDDHSALHRARDFMTDNGPRLGNGLLIFGAFLGAFSIVSAAVTFFVVFIEWILHFVNSSAHDYGRVWRNLRGALVMLIITRFFAVLSTLIICGELKDWSEIFAEGGLMKSPVPFFRIAPTALLGLCMMIGMWIVVRKYIRKTPKLKSEPELLPPYGMPYAAFPGNPVQPDEWDEDEEWYDEADEEWEDED